MDSPGRVARELAAYWYSGCLEAQLPGDAPGTQPRLVLEAPSGATGHAALNHNRCPTCLPWHLPLLFYLQSLYASSTFGSISWPRRDHWKESCSAALPPFSPSTQRTLILALLVFPSVGPAFGLSSQSHCSSAGFSLSSVFWAAHCVRRLCPNTGPPPSELRDGACRVTSLPSCFRNWYYW